MQSVAELTKPFFLKTMTKAAMYGINQGSIIEVRMAIIHIAKLYGKIESLIWLSSFSQLLTLEQVEWVLAQLSDRAKSVGVVS